MPTYEYECTKGHTFEAVQRISEPALTKCTVCNAKVRRLIGAPRFILKGGGWYADGYSGGSSSSTSSKSSSGESKSASSDSKSASSDSGSSSSSASSPSTAAK